jgi:hypothetical protein
MTTAIATTPTTTELLELVVAALEGAAVLVEVQAASWPTAVPEAALAVGHVAVVEVVATLAFASKSPRWCQFFAFCSRLDAHSLFHFRTSHWW